MISGVAGLGKSRLADEVAAVLAPSTPVHRIVGSPNAADVAFGASAHLFATDDDIGGFEPPDVLSTRRALRRALLGDGPPEGPVVLVDDAHRIDEATATVIHQLVVAREARVVATVRTGEPGPEAVEALRGSDHCHHLALQPLARHEVGLLAQAALGRWLDHDSLDHLTAASEGNPLLLRELLADAEASGRLVEARGLLRWTGPGASVRLSALVAQDLERSSPEEIELIDLVAIAEPVALPVARRLATTAVLGGLEARGLLHVDGADREWPVVRLAHPLFGEVRRAGLGPLRRAHLLAVLVDAHATAGLGATDRARVVAWRTELGHPVGSDDLLDAAATARAHGDERGAELLARRALEAGPSPEAELLLAEVAESASRFEEARARTEGLVARLGRDEQRARALGVTLRVLTHGLRLPDDAEAALARDLVHLHDPVWRGFVQAQWATLATMLGRLSVADSLGASLLTHPDDRVRLRALPAVNMADLARGRPQLAHARASELVGPALRHRDDLPMGVAVVFSALAFDLFALGALDELEGLLALAREGAVAGTANRGHLLLVEGSVALRRGSASAASRLLADAVRAFDESDPQGFAPTALALASQAAATAGDPAAARLLREECLRRSGTRGRLVDHGNRRAVAWALAADGDPGAARRELRAVAEEARRAGLHLFEMEALHDAARLGGSQRLLTRLGVVAGSVEGPRAEAVRDHAAALRAGRAPAVEAVAERFAALGELLVAAELWAHAAGLHRSAGTGAGARRANQRARALLDRCEGAVTDLPVDAPDPLTPRERQVASLAAAGVASAAIAEQLGVSRRTVDNQLGRVYAKLGISGRSELASVLDGARPA